MILPVRGMPRPGRGGGNRGRPPVRGESRYCLPVVDDDDDGGVGRHPGVPPDRAGPGVVGYANHPGRRACPGPHRPDGRGDGLGYAPHPSCAQARQGSCLRPAGMRRARTRGSAYASRTIQRTGIKSPEMMMMVAEPSLLRPQAAISRHRGGGGICVERFRLSGRQPLRNLRPIHIPCRLRRPI